MREAGLKFEKWKNYDWIKIKYGDFGYAGYYLIRSRNESTMINEANSTVYKRLVDIDTSLGTELSLQLWGCLSLTTRWDIIKV